MRQIVMNLVINASEAIGDRSGVIAITTGCMDCDRNYLKDVWLDENLADGLYVYLEIADSGCGMDKETLSRLFDPFFTTKFTGRGLGMAAVLGIIRGHRGAIKVYSEPGRGTTFKILLPASGRPDEIFNGKPMVTRGREAERCCWWTMKKRCAASARRCSKNSASARLPPKMGGKRWRSSSQETTYPL